MTKLRLGPFTEGRQGDQMISRNRKNLVVDIHCHLNIPAADELMRPHLSPHAFQSFSCPASDEVNRETLRRLAPKLNIIEECIADMDRRATICGNSISTRSCSTVHIYVSSSKPMVQSTY